MKTAINTIRWDKSSNSGGIMKKVICHAKAAKLEIQLIAQMLTVLSFSIMGLIVLSINQG